MTADRTPAIIAALVDAHHDAEDLQAAAALDRTVDLSALSDILPIGEADRALADGLRGLIVDGDDSAELADADRAITCRVAARLASTAALLLAVDPKRNLSDAEVLWSMSGKLSGLWATSAKAARQADPPAVDPTETYRLAAEQWKTRAEKAEATAEHWKRDRDFMDECRLRREAELAEASWEATQGAHALAMVGGAVGLSNLPRDPLDAAKAIIEAMRPAPARTPSVQVGDIIDAKDVPPGTLVECDNGDLVLRMLNGRGWAIDCSRGPCADGWTWQTNMADEKRVRVMAAGLISDGVASMTPREAREWLAKRIAAEPVRLVQVVGGASGDIITAPK